MPPTDEPPFRLEIEIVCESVPAPALRDELGVVLTEAGTAIDLEIRSRSAYRSPGPDPAVLVAIVSGTSAIVSGLIAGIFAFIAKRKSPPKKIVVVGSDGTRVEFPIGVSPAETARLVELARQLMHPRIYLP